MRDLFFAMYGNGIEWTIWCLLFLLIGVILLIVSLVKLKRKAKITGIILSILLIWQMVPVGFYYKAIVAGFNNQSYTELYKSYYGQKNDSFNYPNYLKYMNIAINTSLIPWQKGVYYCEIAKSSAIPKKGTVSIEYYNKAYKYIKSYKYQLCWLLAPFAYDAAGNTNKAIEIADELKLYSLISIYYIGEGKYSEALDAANKGVQLSPNNYSCYLYRAYANMALGNKTDEYKDYQMALSLAKNDKQKQMVFEYKQLRDKELARKKQAAINMGFIKE